MTTLPETKNGALPLGPSDTDLAWKRLGAMIAQLRGLRRMKGIELGRASGNSQSRISNIENGHVHLEASELETIATALRATEDERAQLRFAHGLTEVPELNLRAVIAHGVDRRQRDIQFYEQLVSQRQEFANALMPGLLQTEEYAGEVMRLLGLSRAEADAAVEARVMRQKILRDARRRFEFILAESVLYNRPGDAHAQVGQLHDLMLFIQRIRHVRIGILPLERGTAPMAFNGFVIFDSQAVTTETVVIEQVFSDPEDVATYQELYGQLRGRAVFDAAAADRIGRAIRVLLRQQDV